MPYGGAAGLQDATLNCLLHLAAEPDKVVPFHTVSYHPHPIGPTLPALSRVAEYQAK